MSELFHTGPGPDPAQGADVLASIRRLLAQDAADEEAGSRHAALRRRLIGLRRGSGATAASLSEPSRGGSIGLPEAAAPLPAPAAPPLRLADTQRVPPADGGAAMALTDAMPAARPAAPPAAETSLSDGDSGGDWPFSGEARLRNLLTFPAWIGEDGGFAAPASPAAAVVGMMTPPVPQALPQALPSQSEAEAADRPAQSLPVPHPVAAPPDPITPEALPPAAIRVAPEPVGGISTPLILPPPPLVQAVPEAALPRGNGGMGVPVDASLYPPGAEPAPEANIGLPLTALATPSPCAAAAPEPALPGAADRQPALAAAGGSDDARPLAQPAEAPDAEALRIMLRHMFLAELSGETGRHLSEAVNLLTRRAMAGALADLAREMGALHAGDGTDLH